MASVAQSLIERAEREGKTEGGGGRERAPFQLCLNDVTLPRIGEFASIRASGQNRIRGAGSAIGVGVGMLFDPHSAV